MAIRKKFQGAWDTASGRVAERRKNLGKYARDIDTSRPKFSSSGLGIGMTRTSTVTKSGAASAALSDLNAAEARLSRLRSTIRRYKAAVGSRAHLRRERIRAYYDTIYRYLLKSKGKGMPEDAMKGIFEKALRVK